MFDRIKTALINLVHRVFRVKIMTTIISEPTFLPPAAEPVATYCQQLQLLKQLKGIEALRRWRVSRARTFKCKSASQHEYVSATIIDPENKTHHLVFERLRGDPENSLSPITETTHPLTRLSPSGSNSSLSSLSSASFSAYAANDRIVPVGASGKKKEEDVEVYDLVFPEGFCLHELAILAFMVHQTNSSYLLMTNNCYYYAGTIMKILEKKHNISNAVKGANAGRWCFINIFGGAEFEKCRPLLESVEKAIREFVSFFFSA